MITSIKINEEKSEHYYELNISLDDNKWNLFLSNEHNEGMGLSEHNLFSILDEYFKKEF